MKNLPFVSIIIPTYNRANMLSITIDSFLNLEYPKEKFELIISDNNSTDSTENIVKFYLDKPKSNVKYIFESKQGVHYARNSAAKIAKGDILYFTDDDMIATPSLLIELVHLFDFDEQLASITGMVLGKFDEEPPQWVQKYLINGYLSLTDKNREEELIISRNDCGVFSCHQAVKRTVFFESGGFNPENTAGVWIGDGETGLNIKIKDKGYKFGYTSKSLIYHMIPPSRTTTKYIVNRIGNQGFCDSYTDYRKHRNHKKLFLSMLKRNIRHLVELGFLVLRVIRGGTNWRFILASIAYNHRRNRYDLKLLLNQRFRKLVEIDDWLKEEPLIKF